MLNNNSGRSMIEMLGVLAIVGMLSVGGMAGFTKVMQQNKIKTAIEQISVISGQLSNIGASGSSYDGKGAYAGLNNKVAVKTKAVLEEMRTKPGDQTDFGLKSPFGGSVTISTAKLLSRGGDDQAYTITYAGLDAKTCVALATQDWGTAKNSSFIGLAAGSSASADNIYLNCAGSNASNNAVVGCNGGDTTGIPIPISKATTACKSCTNNCMIVLKYY